MKKNPTPKESPPPSQVESYTVGTGFTKRQLYRLKGPLCPEHLPFIKKLSNRNAFNGTIADTEASARQILTEAGLPSDPRLCYTISEGERVLSLEPIPGTLRLIDLVTARGYRERVDQVWYASKILDLAQIIREIAGKDEPWVPLSLSAELGELVGEAKALGFFKQAGSEGPPTRKPHKSPYPLLARYLLRNYPDENDVHRFNMVPTISDDELPLGRYRFHREAGRIHADERVGSKAGSTWKPVGKPLKLAAFRKHMTKERKRISR